MTTMDKERIAFYRAEGLGYKAIASKLDVSVNSVKSYCRRAGLTSRMRDKVPACRNCQTPLAQGSKHKPRKFCCDTCRQDWWNAHPHLVARKAFYSLVCHGCGAAFNSYGNRNRKYCSRTCYIKARYGKEASHGQSTV